MYEKNSDSDWYCVINDDGMLIRKNLEKILENYNSQQDWYLGSANYKSDLLKLGYYIKDQNSEYKDLYYASGGPGFFFSNSLMKKIYPRINDMLNL